jgi:DNA-binding winged helix-turn-helix (wHTH) protein
MPLGARIVYEFCEFQLDAEIGALSYLGERLALQPKAAEVLIALLDAGGACVPTEELIRRVWDEPTAGRPHLHYQLTQIRALLAARAPDRKFIETVPRIGVRFLPSVTRTPKDSTGIDAAPQPTQSSPIERASHLAARPRGKRRWGTRRCWPRRRSWRVDWRPCRVSARRSASRA